MRAVILLLVIGLAVVAAFTCPASDRTLKTIPAAYVGDDYCDCELNGEDERGSAGCAHTSTPFVCEGDVDKKAIPMSFVRDGICDCCDGSDEVAGRCVDTCAAEREQRLEQARAEMALHLAGEATKKTYMKLGQKGVKQLDASVKELRREVKVAEEELQAKIYSQGADQQMLQMLYSALVQKKQNLQVLEKLTTLPNAFGAKREFYPLLGQCYRKLSNEKQFKGGSFEHVAKDFLFEVCPFGQIVQYDASDQKAKPTLLGVFQEWDEEQANVMIYSGGDECWNGPARVVRVEMVCGEKDELVDVKENGKCTYEFKFASPAACNRKHADKLKKYIQKLSPEREIIHDEL